MYKGATRKVSDKRLKTLLSYENYELYKEHPEIVISQYSNGYYKIVVNVIFERFYLDKDKVNLFLDGYRLAEIYQNMNRGDKE